MSFARWCVILVCCFTASFGRGEESDATLSIEPLAGTLPANFLKFYLHFSEPMERGDVFRYLRLVKVSEDGSAEEVIEPFREVELWGVDFKTLTLWLHPGRQKPGVNLNVDLGPVLEEGEVYRLLVSSDWKTQSGGQLTGDLSKTFRAGPADKKQPDPGDWSVARRSPHKLIITTGDQLDPASARKRIRIIDESSDDTVSVLMTVREDGVDLLVGPSEQEATGVAPHSWSVGSYRLIVYPQLEDLAGNSIARPFNLDLDKFPDFVEKTEPVEIPFTIDGDSNIHLTKP